VKSLQLIAALAIELPEDADLDQFKSDLLDLTEQLVENYEGYLAGGYRLE